MIGMLLAVGAGANFRYYSADRSASFQVVSDDNELIDLTALQPYVRYDAGKLYVDISHNNPNHDGGDGMSPNTTYVFEEMFNVSNELWENEQGDYPICVTLSGVPQNENVQLFAGTYDNPIAGPGTTITFTVTHDSPVSIGMIFNNTNVANGTSHQFDLSITAVAGACTT